MKNALTIAGSDSGGGAGVQADMKTFSALGVYGLSTITCITAQNSRGIKDVYPLPPEIVKKQLVAVMEDFEIDAGKTGALYSGEIIRKIADVIKKSDFPLVVDPVMRAKDGTSLLKDIDTFIKYIVPLAHVITPNKYEAEMLGGVKIKRKEDVKKCAIEIKKLGAEAVLIKGGHIGRSCTDFLYYRNFREYRGKRIREGCLHGTGCCFSASLTANLALGLELGDAIKTSKKFIETAIKYGIKMDDRNCPVNPIAHMAIDAEKWRVYETLDKAVDEIVRENPIDFIPEVGMNFVYSPPKIYTKGIEDIAGVDGRIVKGRMARRGEIRFGASSHLARAILKAMEYDEKIRCAINIKYREDVIERARKRKLVVSHYERRMEPEDIKKEEGKTVQWGVEMAIKKANRVPDVVYHEGDVGKEPMIIIFGENPEDVLNKFRLIRV